jgi:hypothetical protein
MAGLSAHHWPQKIVLKNTVKMKGSTDLNETHINISIYVW